jgi:hypothetical protein
MTSLEDGENAGGRRDGEDGEFDKIDFASQFLRI